MNRTPDQLKQKVIIPKGTVRQNETAVIEIPIEYQNEPVVVVKPKVLTSAKSCPGSKSPEGISLGLMHTYNINNNTDDSLGIMNECQMNNGFSNVRHSPSCGNNACVTNTLNQTNPAPKSYKKITKTVIKTSPADDSSCMNINCPSKSPSRVYKKVITTTITEGPDGQINTTTTTTTSNKELTNILQPNQVVDKSSGKTDEDATKAPKPEQKDDDKPESKKEASVVENQETTITDDNSGYHIDKNSLGILRPDEMSVTPENLQQSSITSVPKKSIDEDSLGILKSDEINVILNNRKTSKTSKDSLGILKPDEMNVSNAGNNQEPSQTPQTLATSTPRASEDKGNNKSKRTCTNRNCAANTSKAEVRSFKKVVKKTTITRSATDDSLGLLNINQMRSGFEPCSGTTNSNLGIMKSEQMGSTFQSCNNTTRGQSPCPNSGQDSLGIIHSGQMVSGFGSCSGADQNKQQFGQTFVPCNNINQDSLGIMKSGQKNSGFIPRNAPCLVQSGQMINTFGPCNNANQNSLGIMQPGQMNSSFIPCSENAGINLSAVHSRQATNQSNLGIMQPGQMGSGFVPCDNQGNLGQMTYTFGTSRPKINLNATQVQQTGSSMRPCQNLGIMNSGQMNNNQGTFGSNVGQMNGTNQSSLGQMGAGFATYSIKQSNASCSPYTEINQSRLGIIQSGQTSSGFITNTNQISSSFGPCSVNNQSSLGIMKPMNTAFVPCAESTRIYLNNPCSDSTNLSAVQPGLNVTRIQSNPRILQPNQMSNNATYTLNPNQTYVTNESSLGIMKPMNSAFVPCAESTRIYLTNPCSDSYQSSLGIMKSDQMCTGPCSESTVPGLNVTTNQNNPGVMQPNQTSNNATYMVNPNQTNVTNEIMKPEQMSTGSNDNVKRESLNMTLQAQDISAQHGTLGLESNATTGDLKQTMQQAPVTNTEASLGLIQSGQMNATYNIGGTTEQNSLGIIQPNQMNSGFQSSATTEDIKQTLQKASMNGTTEQRENLNVMLQAQTNSTQDSTFNTSGSLGIVQPDQMSNGLEGSATNGDVKQILQTNTQDSLGLLQSGQMNTISGGSAVQGNLGIIQSSQMSSDTKQAPATSAPNSLGLMQSGQMNGTFYISGSTIESSSEAIQPNQTSDDLKKILEQVQANKLMRSDQVNSTPDTSGNTFPLNRLSSKDFKIQQAMLNSRTGENCLGTTFASSTGNFQQCNHPILLNQNSNLGQLQTSQMSSGFEQNTNALKRSKPSYRKIIKTTTITKKSDEDSSVGLMPSTDLSASYISSSSSKQPSYKKVIKTTTITKTPVDESSLGLIQSDQMSNYLSNHPKTTSSPNVSNSTCRSECPSATVDSSRLGLPIPQSNQMNSAIHYFTPPQTSSKASSLGILKPSMLSNSSYRSKSPRGSFGSSYSQNNTSLGLLPSGAYITNHSDFNKNKTSTCRKECPSLGNLATQQSFPENTVELLPSSHLNATDYFNHPGYIIRNNNNQMRLTLSSQKSGNTDDSLGILPSNCLTRSSPTNRNLGLQHTLYSPVRQFKYLDGKRNNSPLCQTRYINTLNDQSLGLLSPNIFDNYNSSVRSVQDQISRIISSTPILKRSEEKETQQLSQCIEQQLKSAEAAEQIKLHNDLKHYQQTRRQLVANASRIANLRKKGMPNEKN